MVSLFLLFLNILVANIPIDRWMDMFNTNVSHNDKLKVFAHIPRLLLLTNTMFTVIPFTVARTMFFSAHLLPVKISEEDKAHFQKCP